MTDAPKPHKPKPPRKDEGFSETVTSFELSLGRYDPYEDVMVREIVFKNESGQAVAAMRITLDAFDLLLREPVSGFGALSKKNLPSDEIWAFLHKLGNAPHCECPAGTLLEAHRTLLAPFAVTPAPSPGKNLSAPKKGKSKKTANLPMPRKEKPPMPE